MRAPADTVILRAGNLTKRFPGVVALQNVTIDLMPGEVHAVCGENGAGKSTLIKILAGVHPSGSYEGDIVLFGSPVAFRSTRDAERAGLAVIHQELALVPELSAAENIYLGSEPTRWGFLDWNRIYSQALVLFKRLNIDLDPTVRVADLGIGRQQLLEIMKAIAKESKILLLDEPTAALSERETDTLFEIIGDLKQQGITCVYISHKLEEVFRIADRITVLRDGRLISTCRREDTDRNTVIREMVGRKISEFYPKREAQEGEVLLEVKSLSVAAEHGEQTLLENIGFQVRAGEVLGLGGLMGAGRTELLMHIFGLLGKRKSGDVKLRGRPLAARSPLEAIRSGLVLVGEDRRRFGLIPDGSVLFNLSLASLPRLTRWGLVDGEKEVDRCRNLMGDLNIKGDLEKEVRYLSGGNQQKVVLGKALLTEPLVYFLDEPTRGIDVGAKVEVYQIINELVNRGKGVVMASSELPELMSMCDRILILSGGRIGGEFRKEEFAQEKLLAAALTN